MNYTCWASWSTKGRVAMATDNRQQTYKVIHSLGELQSNICKASFTYFCSNRKFALTAEWRKIWWGSICRCVNKRWVKVSERSVCMRVCDHRRHWMYIIPDSHLTKGSECWTYGCDKILTLYTVRLTVLLHNTVHSKKQKYILVEETCSRYCKAKR